MNLDELEHFGAQPVHLVDDVVRHHQGRVRLLQALAGGLLQLVQEATVLPGLVAGQLGVLLRTRVALQQHRVHASLLRKSDDLARVQQPVADRAHDFGLLLLPVFICPGDFEAYCGLRQLCVG